MALGHSSPCFSPPSHMSWQAGQQSRNSRDLCNIRSDTNSCRTAMLPSLQGGARLLGTQAPSGIQKAAEGEYLQAWALKTRAAGLPGDSSCVHSPTQKAVRRWPFGIAVLLLSAQLHSCTLGCQTVCRLDLPTEPIYSPHCTTVMARGMAYYKMVISNRRASES